MLRLDWAVQFPGRTHMIGSKSLVRCTLAAWASDGLIFPLCTCMKLRLQKSQPEIWGMYDTVCAGKGPASQRRPCSHPHHDHLARHGRSATMRGPGVACALATIWRLSDVLHMHMCRTCPAPRIMRPTAPSSHGTLTWTLCGGVWPQSCSRLSGTCGPAWSMNVCCAQRCAECPLLQPHHCGPEALRPTHAYAPGSLVHSADVLQKGLLP